METVQERIERVHQDSFIVRANAMKRADTIDGIINDTETNCVVSDKKKRGAININVESNVTNGTKCPSCGSYLCVSRGMLEPKLTKEEDKLKVGVCASCGYNPYGRPFKKRMGSIDRNGPCPCGSGKKYKKCCLNITKHLGKNVAEAVLHSTKNEEKKDE